jgi:hypothetical protein
MPRGFSFAPLAPRRAARQKRGMSLEADLLAERRCQMYDGAGKAFGINNEAVKAKSHPLPLNSNDMSHQSCFPLTGN